MKKATGAAILALCTSFLAHVAFAFDAGPHAQMTEDALRAEGFGAVAIQIVQVDNWFDDLYEKARDNEFFELDDCPEDIEVLSDLMHFDQTSGLHNTQEVQAEWQRLVRATYAETRRLARARDYAGLLILLGMTSHIVQDFYAHTNWVETVSSLPQWGGCEDSNIAPFLVCQADWGVCSCNLQSCDAFGNSIPTPGWTHGPGWRATGRYGSHPTWFDVSEADRMGGVPVYSESRYANVTVSSPACGMVLCANDPRRFHCAPNPPFMDTVAGTPERGHGNWRTDMNLSLSGGINKDNAGRPLYTEAYLTAYAATRQWLQAMSAWVNNPSVWNGMRSYANRHVEKFSYYDDDGVLRTFQQSLNREMSYMVRLSVLAGGWDGNGTASLENDYCYAGANASGVALAGQNYFFRGFKSYFRRRWEAMSWAVMAGCPPRADVQIPSSRPIQSGLQFVRFEVQKVQDLVDDWTDSDWDQEDWRAKTVIAGQTFGSGMIDDRNAHDFTVKPYGPWTSIKALSAGEDFDEPVATLKVRVRTCSVAGAGTDDDVFLRLRPGWRQEFPYSPSFNDFDRGRDDTYAFDPKGLRIRDITMIQIEKPQNDSDGDNGEWCLDGVEVTVNGRRLYAKSGINTWLDGATRLWRAGDFDPQSPRTPYVPLRLALADLDPSENEVMDVNPLQRLTAINLLYSRASGRYSGDVAGFGYSPRLVSGGGGDLNKSATQFAIHTLKASPPPDVYRLVASAYDKDLDRQQWFGPGIYSGGIMVPIAEDAIDAVIQPPWSTLQLCRGDGLRECTDWLNGTAGTVRRSLPAALRNNVSSLRLSPVAAGFSGAGFTGNRQYFEPGLAYRSAALAGVGNNAISSLVVSPGMELVACVDDKLLYTVFDKCRTYTADNPDLSDDYDDRISAVFAVPVAVAFNGTQLAGTRSQNLRPGTYRLSRGQLEKVGGTATRSLLVPPGWKVKICDGEGADGTGGGTCATYAGTALSLGNLGGNIAFIKVIRPVESGSSSRALGRLAYAEFGWGGAD